VPVLRHAPRIEDGHLIIDDRPGSGVDWDEQAIARYLV